jgi:hypothetical protein
MNETANPSLEQRARRRVAVANPGLKKSADMTDCVARKEFAMKTNLLPSIVGTAVAAFISSGALAEPRQPVSAENPEPYRIYDLGSRNVINNPDYREPTRVKPMTKRVKRATEPDRVYNPMSQQFDDSPEIRQPRSRRR